jgi:hypothetical protein
MSTTIIVTDPKELPPDYGRLADPQPPLPPGVRFFEERKNWRGLGKRVGLSVFFIVLGLLLIATDYIVSQTIGEIDLFVLTLIGLGCWFAAFLLIRSLWPNVRIMRRQQTGEATRYGVFISAAALLIHTDLDLTLIPRGNVVKLDGLQLHYTWNDKPKALHLPDQLVGASPDALIQAVRAWLAA